MKPRCFKGVKSFSADNRANKKAWITTEVSKNWLLTVNGDMQRQKRNVLLFLDNCTVHNIPPTLSNVELYFFPLNTTSKLQPLDQGIIHNFKTFYLKEIETENLPILMDDKESAIEPLVDISGGSFSDFVQVDEMLLSQVH
ncbi:unnamed protein product [Pieris macdunnoughi]|uniref:DDE-1 domain-containing protein n=1 Tax=Pieris macdunnoughi TaxID=345717 RepID=A0A821WX35_9NEOP|nr:unnamed protein product [Pieris macdunnoughi]